MTGNVIDKSITSDQNALFKMLLDCLATKGIKKHEMFMMSGERAVGDALARFPDHALNLLLCDGRHVVSDGVWAQSISDQATGALVRQAKELTTGNATRFSVIVLNKPLFEQLDVAGTHAPILVLKNPEIPIADLSVAPVGLEILCAMSDPSNVGALLRSAAAFGASRVILLKESASPLHPKAVRAASAATLLTPLSRGPSIQDLVPAGVVALDMSGADLSKFKWPKNVRLLIGEEGQGVPRTSEFHQELQLISIPIAKDVESLNATVAASVALYSYRLQNN
jgi:TrmH family RNA methyltransferase